MTTSQRTYDAIIIGSGINALVNGALLARKGWKVLICERNDRPGGAIRTEAATLPGYTHELLSSWHPLFVGGPAYGELKEELEKRGVVYKNTVYPTGVICKSGSAILSTNPAITTEELAKHGDDQNWGKFLGEFGAKIDLAFGVLGLDFWRLGAIGFARKAQKKLGRRGVLTMGAEMLEPAAPWLDRTFSSEVTKSLLAPWALHNGLGPDDASSAFITKVIGAAVAFGGMPVPVGGGVRLVEALVGIVKDHGGELLLHADVTTVTTTEAGSKKRATGVRLADGREFHASKAVIASVTPQALYTKLLGKEDSTAEVYNAAENFRYGRAAIQIHLALSEPPQWRDNPKLGEVALVHILDGMDSLSESVNAANRGWLPRRPTIVVGQPTTMDPSRAPEGASLLWIQLQENPRVIEGDLAGEIAPGDGSWNSERLNQYADRVINQIAERIPNLKSSIKAKIVLGPKEIEAMNINLVGGDPYAGDCRVDQYAPWRPLVTATGHVTTVKNLFHIGASTHPGPGLGGGSGYMVAKRLTERTFLERILRK